MTVPRPSSHALCVDLPSERAPLWGKHTGPSTALTSACSDGSPLGRGVGGLQISHDASVQVLRPLLEWDLVSGSLGGPSGVADPPARM